MAVPLAGAQLGASFMGGPVNIGAPYFYTAGTPGMPGLTFAFPFSQGSYLLEAFNTSTLAHTDTEALAIAFPTLEGGWTGSTPAAGPDIAQTRSETMAATRSYFFIDFVAAA